MPTLLKILTALKEPKGDLTAARNALEALLTLDKSKTAEVQKIELNAILTTHKAFWKDAQNIDPGEADVPDRLKQEVAEVLVMQGLKNANAQTLVGLFSGHNETQLLQYINDKIANGKFVKVVETQRQLDTDFIFSKETEADIKGRAAELLLLHLPEIGSNSAPGQKSLKAFIDSTEPTTAKRLENFLAACNVDEATRKNIVASLRDEKENIFSRLLKKSHDEFIKQAYPLYVAGAKLEGIIPPLPTILHDNVEFKKHLLNALELKIGTPVSTELVNDAKALLGLKYLQAQLIKKGMVGDELVVLNSVDNVALTSFIQKQLHDDTNADRDAYIGLAVEKDGALLKTAILKNHIKTLALDKYEDLTALVNTSDPVAFKKALEKLGIKPPAEWIKGREQKEIVDSVKLRIQELKNIQLPLVQTSLAKEMDPQKLRKIIEAKDLVALKAVINDPAFAHGHWVEDAEMRQIQQFALSRLMQLQLEKATTLGGQAHKKLINAIASLPPASQRKLVADDKLPTLRALMDITDKDKLKTIFGGLLTETQATVLIDENIRLAGFRQIQNAGLAKVLANFRETITLTLDEISEINSKLFDYEGEDFDDIEELLDVLPKSLLDKYPHLNQDIKNEQDAIIAQQKINAPLMTLLHEMDEEDEANIRTPAEKALLETLLKLNVAIDYKEPNAKLMENLNKLLNTNHESAEQFISSLDATIVENPGQLAALKKALPLEMSETAFVQIQKERRKNLFATDPEKYNIEIAASLSQIKSKEKAVLDSASQLKAFIESDLFVAGSKDMAFGPAFDAMVKQRPVAIKAELDILLEKNKAIVEYLSDNKMHLITHLESLPAIKTPPNKDTEKLRTSLNAELKTISQKLEQYVDALKQIKTLVGEVNRVVGGKEDYVYHSAEIKHSTCSEEDLQKRIKAVRDKIPFTGPSQSALVAEINPLPDKGPVKSEIAVKSALAEGHAHHISEVETISKVGTKNVVTQGSYAQTYFQGTASTGKDDQVNRAVGCRVEQIQGPTVVNNPSGPPTPVSADAKATYYLNMAMSLLVANGGKPPTKDNPIKLKGGTEDEMRLLWTALMIVGKESKIKFGKDEIKILTGTFDPDKEITSSWRGKSYAETSAHEQIFKVDGKFPPHVKRKIEDADEMATTGKITVKALEKTVPNTTAFKEMFEAQKSSPQKAFETVANKIAPKDIAVDILTKLVDELPPSNPKAQLATQGLTG